jgi:hypothetical protein
MVNMRFGIGKIPTFASDAIFGKILEISITFELERLNNQ